MNDAPTSREYFKPALLVVDMQEDFCGPSGSLAVEGGRDIAPTINSLLSLPFALKIATKDAHPQGHVSFAISHPPPNNKAFESAVKISNPMRRRRTRSGRVGGSNIIKTTTSNDKSHYSSNCIPRYLSDRTQFHEIPLWPVHCVQGTKGAEIIPEIDVSKLDEVVEKGKDSGLEMFSGFADIFGSKSPEAASQDLAGLLHCAGITTVFAVGLAGDYCVKCTALDAKKEGFEVYVVKEATRSVDAGENGWGKATKEMREARIEIISVEGPEMARVKSLK
ncbi:hypothetical protein HO133_009199 [Letharia lupina]|uniref:nicotinamidase n=1 Tax=Letharia lupina TaxID=560253 RepID=A0A8H6CMS4_9LECA|nr:uncharacterized protein HO133_009199 [Letharia lupina]KAF6226333.1 hypothetical protein HO133_009199 [Letharia lupina]